MDADKFDKVKQSQVETRKSELSKTIKDSNNKDRTEETNKNFNKLLAEERDLGKIKQAFSNHDVNLFCVNLERSFELEDIDEPLNKYIPYEKKNNEKYKRIVIRHLKKFTSTKYESVQKPRLKALSPTKRKLETKRKSFSASKLFIKMKALKDKSGAFHKLYCYKERDVGFNGKWQRKVKPQVAF